MRKYYFAALLALAAQMAGASQPSAAPPASVEIVAKRDAAWASYRNAYKGAAKYAAYLRAMPLIQVHMQIVPRKAGVSLDGLRLQLTSETVTQDIALDAIGRATLPMNKQAFDEDAVLRLNRGPDNFRFTGRYSIRENDSGVYSAALLRTACEQIISAQREMGGRLRLLGKKCAGVRFIYRPDNLGAELKLRDAMGKPGVIAAADAAPFDGVPMGLYRVVTYRFDAWPAQGDVLSEQRPLFIGTVYE